MKINIKLIEDIILTALLIVGIGSIMYSKNIFMLLFGILYIYMFVTFIRDKEKKRNS